MATKRQTRCGYCWQSGHNRLSCPKMKQEAAAGDKYAQRSLERSKVKQCSYCHSTDHIKSGCLNHFNDERRQALCYWTGVSAIINVVQEKKIAAGAFIYGPIMHRWNSTPLRENDTHTMGNFSVKKVEFSSTYEPSEFEGVITYDTLAESADGAWFKTKLPIPGISHQVQGMPDSLGRTVWLEKHNPHYDHDARICMTESFQVIVEASQEEVDKTVAELTAMKPLIVDFTDMKEYQSAKRKLAKANKQASEEV